MRLRQLVPEIIITAILSIFLTGQTYAATLTATPDKVPKGAYVNGPMGATDDNYFWQTLKLTFQNDHLGSSQFTLTLPADMTLADVDGDGNYNEEAAYDWVDADADAKFSNLRLISVNASHNVLTFDSGWGAVSDGDFATAGVPWTYNGNWAHDLANHQANHTAGSALTLTHTFAPTAGLSYIVNFDVNRTSGTSVTMSLGGTSGTAVTASGSYSQIVTAGAATVLTFTPSADFVGSVDNVMVKQILVIDGDFATAGAPWTYNGTWSHDGVNFRANHTAGSGLTLTHTFAPLPSTQYVVKFDVIRTSGTSVTMSLGSTSGAAVVATGTYTQTITTQAGGPGSAVLTFSPTGNFDGSIDNVSVYLVSTGSSETNDYVNIMIPVVTATSPALPTGVYTVAFNVGNTDDITALTGPVITFVDPGPNTIGLISFTSIFSANNDTTNMVGDRYPTTAAPSFGALPDLAPDAGTVGPGGYVNYLNSPLTLNGTEGNNEATYAVWVSTDSTLAHVDSLTSGVFHAIDFATLLPYTTTETSTGNIRYAVGGYPEGKYYFYITSYLTGDFPLARSGSVVVRHWPIINILGWDYNHDLAYTQGTAGLGDDYALTLDTGEYYKYDGTKALTGWYDFIDLYTNVIDLNDNARLSLFYSVSAILDTSAVVRTGSASDSTLTVTGLTGAALIKNNLFENQQDEQGFVKWRWSVNPDSLGLILPAIAHSVYGVVCDGKHFYMTSLKGSDGAGGPGASNLLMNMKNSPKLYIDPLTEYDFDTLTAGIQINVEQHDVIMLNWGKSGKNGDIDYDDSALIEFYAVRDDTPNAIDYKHDDATTIRAASLSSPTTVHKITSGIAENLEAKNKSWFAWDPKKDYKETGWAPVNGANYIIYGIIDENKEGGIVRVVTIGTSYSESIFPQVGDDLSTKALIFTDSPFSRLYDPPAKGVSINAEETYRMKFYSFDWDAGVTAPLGIFIAKTSEATNDTMVTRTILTGMADGSVYCLTSSDGSRANGTWLTANSDSAYFDFTISIPGTGNKYTTDIDAVVTALTAGTYCVYIGIDPDLTDGGGGAFAAGTEILYRAPGTLTIKNVVTPTIKNMFISPMEVTTAQCDTTQFTMCAADNGVPVDRIDAFIAVEKEYWIVVSASAPFTALGTFSGQLIANQVIDDAVNNRWILRLVAFQSGGTPFTITDGGLGEPVASFKLVSKGTTVALEELTSVYFVSEPLNNRVTKFSYGGGDISINTLASTVKVIPRAIIEGIVQLEGRGASNVQFTFDLRKRGSYEPVTDSLFIAANDSNLTSPGIQYRPDTDGKFTFTKIPTGQYDLVVKYDRYVSPLTLPVNVYPGVDNVFVDFGVILGGDCYGYVDSLGNVYPNNVINSGDLNRIRTAFLAIPTNPKWNNGVDNWKWCDINEDNVVEVDDLSMVTKNVNTQGAQPVYKIAASPENANLNASVDFINVPTALKAGQTFTIQVVAKNISGVRAYFVNMKYDTQALTFEKIRKGNFISSDSYSFPVMGEGKVGLVNSVYGEGLFSGDGVLVEVTFTAARDGVFAPEMLRLVEASFVNKDSMKQNVLFNSPLNAAALAPLAFSLGQNFPNPFNPTTTISFSVPEAGQVMINIYDILGRNVRSLVSGQYAPGRYSVVWDAKESNGRIVSSGTYLYTITAGKYTATKRMLFMK